MAKNEAAQITSQINIKTIPFYVNSCQAKLKMYQLKLQVSSKKESQLFKTL